VADEDSSAEQAESPPPAATPAPVVAQPAPARRGSGFVGWLALLLVLALGAAAGWYYLEMQKQQAVQDVVSEAEQSRQEQREQALLQRMAALESRQGIEQGALDTLAERFALRLEDALRAVDEQLLSQNEQVLSQEKALQGLEQALNLQREELDRFNVDDREKWLLAEVEYLLRLANQRLIMAGDVEAAQALLTSADSIVRQIDDVAFHPVRAAVAADLAALRAVPQLDVQGIYLRLAALIEQASALSIFRMPEPADGLAAEPAADWQGRLQQGYQAALAKLSEYIVVRRRDVPYEVLMDPQWESLVRQNLRMLLEQAQVALLLGNQVLYRESLQRAGHWVKEFFAADEARSQALSYELSRMEGETVQVNLPDISRSMRALDNVVEQRQREG
jgi:uroporphyrin-3 C-methyltransferase